MTPGPRRATRARRTIAVGAALTAAAAAVAGLAMSGSHTHARAGNARARAPGPAGVAAAYGNPLRCLSVEIAPDNRSFARADFNHTLPCGRYSGYATAIFRRVDGAWVPVLEAISYPCPVRSLPVRVQVELGVCLPRAAGGG